MKPWEFVKLTPKEFYMALEAYREKQKNDDMRKAYFISWIIAPHVKSPVPPKTIYSGLWGEGGHKQTKAELDELKKEFGLLQDGEK